jgi:predicted GIY-YIG superfamily endonuclease
VTTTLYRFYADDDALLYIGIAGSATQRFEQHAKEKSWWPQVTRTELEHFATRREALDAERLAIIAERPRHNVVHNTAMDTNRRECQMCLSWTKQAHMGDTCPACDKPAIYSRARDRCFHRDGSGNERCWLAITRGEVVHGPDHQGVWRWAEKVEKKPDRVLRAWWCEFCKGLVRDGDGYLELDRSDRWHVMHRGCDPNINSSRYWIGVERIRLESQVAEWQAHLEHKRWFDLDHWLDTLITHGKALDTLIYPEAR